VRVAFIGGTKFVGPVSVRAIADAGHEVAVAHSGAHEAEGLGQFSHLHESRAGLLGANGLVERWRPDVLVDTFPGGATAEKAVQLGDCARRAGVDQIVAISSIDVYQHCVDGGLADGSGAQAFSSDPIPLRESARLRTAPYPGGGPEHDNVAMEAALQGARRITVLRPGAIYGPYPRVRESFLVDRIARGESALPLPDGGVQLWHRVAVGRVANAVVAALERAPDDFWACNVADPYDWDYSGLAARIAELLDWRWEPQRVSFHDEDHPWQTSHPVLVNDQRLREVLGVTAPDPEDALAETVRWLWQHRQRVPL
jgi:nucleoside-diphosphate-sugar epimerase